MSLGVALFVVALLSRFATANQHVRGRLTASAWCFAFHALIGADIAVGRVSVAMRQQLLTVQPLLLVFGIANALVAVAINPWRTDRVPDRFPRIVQDAIVIAIFGFIATLLLQDKIFAATAAGAVVIGLALQDTLGNLFAGLAIQVEKPFRVGHWVQIAGTDGQVSQVTWRATKIRTRAGNFVVVPNSKLADDVIVNYSEPTLETRMNVDVGVTYDAPPNRVKAVILDAIRDEPLLSQAQKPEVLVENFAASAVTYRLHAWHDDFAADEHLRDRLQNAIWYAFQRERLEIPFPTQIEYSREDVRVTRSLNAAGISVLRRVSIFASLGEAEQRALEEAAVEGPYPAGAVIVRQGDPGASMFVVVGGEVVVRIEPERQEVARIGPGGFFGEMSLLTGAARNATVVAATDSHVIEITVDAFRRFVLANPAAVEEIGAAVAARRAELEQRRAVTGVPVSAEATHTLVTRIRRFLGL